MSYLCNVFQFIVDSLDDSSLAQQYLVLRIHEHVPERLAAVSPPEVITKLSIFLRSLIIRYSLIRIIIWPTHVYVLLQKNCTFVIQIICIMNEFDGNCAIKNAETKDDKSFNPWLMKNLELMKELTVIQPNNWLEQDCWTNCDD